MGSPLHRAAAVLAGSILALTLAPAAPALAGEQSAKDATKDVVVSDLDGGVLDEAPKDRARDLTRIGLDYSRRQVALTAEVRELAAQGYAFVWEVRTPANRYWVRFDHLDADIGIEVYDVEAEVPVACDGIQRRVSDRLDRVRLTVPRGCVGKPAWIRFGAVAVGQGGGGFRVDDARRDGDFTNNVITVGKRVFHN